MVFTGGPSVKTIARALPPGAHPSSSVVAAARALPVHRGARLPSAAPDSAPAATALAAAAAAAAAMRPGMRPGTGPAPPGGAP